MRSYFSTSVLLHTLVSLGGPHTDGLIPAQVDTTFSAQKGLLLEIVKPNFPKQEQGPISSACGWRQQLNGTHTRSGMAATVNSKADCGQGFSELPQQELSDCGVPL